MNEEKDLYDGEELGIILARGMARKAQEGEARRYWESLPSEVKMKLPFDAQEATRSIVRVIHDQERFGCGFVAADQYVITAAHCLPQIPVCHSDQVLTTIRSWDGNDEAKLVVIYCDIFSDIAILACETFDGAELPRDGDGFGFTRLVARNWKRGYRPFISPRNASAVLHSHTRRGVAYRVNGVSSRI